MKDNVNRRGGWLDWSRPATWVIVGLVVAVAGAVLMSVQDTEGGVGRAVGVVGILLAAIGFAAYLVTQIRKAIEAGRG